MKAVIFACGRGERLKPLTNSIQKCMIDISGKPCLERIIDHLRSFGIDDIIIHVGYKKDGVMKYFGDQVLYYFESELKSQEESLEGMSNWLMGDMTIVQNGDTLTNVDIEGMLRISDGRNLKFMDKMDRSIFAGTKLLTPRYWFDDKLFTPYYSNAEWFDIGTWTGLTKARSRYK